MTTNQQINHGVIQKVCHLHNCIFHPIHLRRSLSTLLYHFPCVILSLPMCYLLKIKKKKKCGMREKKIFCRKKVFLLQNIYVRHLNSWSDSAVG